MAQSYNPTNNAQIQGTGNIFNRMLRNLSNWGMNYEEEVFRNKQSIGINEDPSTSDADGGMYDFFSNRAIASVLSRKHIAYLDRAYADKRRILREYSIKDEIREFITTICDEIVVYDDDFKFCKPRPISNDYPQEVRDRYAEVFEKQYERFRFNDGKRVWDIAQQLLVDGAFSYEIVWDDKKQNIIGIEEFDPATIIPGYDPMNRVNLWIQNPEDPQYRRVMLDSSVVYISYKSQNSYSETSYVEGLIRPYNQLKLLEQTRIMFNIANATIYQKFTIPIKDLPKNRAEESIAAMIANYSESIVWDDVLGTPEINGMKQIPYNKQIWFPEGESGTPAMDLVSPDGHNLNESDMLTWFYNALKRASRIPFGRFDKDNGGGNLYSNASEMTRDEIKFSNFIQRLRIIFMELMVKPLRLQMLADFPEYIDDSRFVNQIGITFNSNDLFEEWKYLSNFEKRAQIVSTLVTSVMIGDRSYFHPEFLVDKIMKMTEEEKQLNQSYWSKKPIVGSTDGGGDAGFNSSDFGDSSGFGDDTESNIGLDDLDLGSDESELDLGGDDTNTDLGGDDTNTDFEF